MGLASLSSGNTFATEAKELETSVETSEHFSRTYTGPTAEDRRREVSSTWTSHRMKSRGVRTPFWIFHPHKPITALDVVEASTMNRGPIGVCVPNMS